MRSTHAQRFLDDLSAGRLDIAIGHVYDLDEIQQAHADMEHNRAAGKLVVRVHPGS